MPENKVKRCTFASTVERENGREVDKVQKSCGDYTASTENLKRVDFNVISVKKEASKPYPTRETPLTGDFDVELDNTRESTETPFTKSRTVEATKPNILCRVGNFKQFYRRGFCECRVCGAWS